MTRFLCKSKRKPDGIIHRWNAGLVCQGFLFQAETLIVCIWWVSKEMCAVMITKSLQYPRIGRIRDEVNTIWDGVSDK